MTKKCGLLKSSLFYTRFTLVLTVVQQVMAQLVYFLTMCVCVFVCVTSLALIVLSELANV